MGKVHTLLAVYLDLPGIIWVSLFEHALSYEQLIPRCDVHMWRPEIHFGCLSLLLSALVFEIGFFIELPTSARLSGQQASRILLLPLPVLELETWATELDSSPRNWEFKLWSSCLCSHHFTHWVFSQAPHALCFIVCLYIWNYTYSWPCWLELNNRF